MDVKPIEVNENYVKFVIDGISAELINCLRRFASFEVPVMAIDKVLFVKNTSVLYDEMIALRLGLIPLKTDLASYVLPEECKCKGAGCGRCQVKLTLKATGPCVVYAKDLVSKDPAIKPVYPEMPIVRLLDGQELELEAIAVLGKGKVHAKWSAGLAFYQRYPKISIKNVKKPKEVVEVCPRKVFELKNNTLKIVNLEACNLCQACQDQTNDEIVVSGLDDKYIFAFESWGQLPATEVLNHAASKISEQLSKCKI